MRRRSPPGSSIRTWPSSETPAPSGFRSCHSPSGVRVAVPAPQPGCRGSSTTCSASRRVAAAPALGPYGHRLLGISEEVSAGYQQQIMAGCEGIKPGWVRVNFNYFISPRQCLSTSMRAVELIADFGSRLLPDYSSTCIPVSGGIGQVPRSPAAAEPGGVHRPQDGIPTASPNGRRVGTCEPIWRRRKGCCGPGRSRRTTTLRLSMWRV